MNRATGAPSRKAIPERGGQRLVLIHVDLGELECPGIPVGHRLEEGTEDPAWSTPFRPEIDDHGNVAAALQNVALELGLGDLADEVRRCIHGGGAG